MDKKSFFKKTIMSFFIVVTFINAAMLVLGLLFEPESRLGYEAFMFPLLFGVLSMLPSLLMYAKYELSKKQMLLRKLLQLILLEFILLFLLSLNGERSIGVLVSVGISVLFIAVLVHLVLWMLDVKEARILTLELERYQKNQMEEKEFLD